MTLDSNRLFRRWQLLWIPVSVVAAILAFRIFGRNELLYMGELSFLVWFIGFLVGVELFAPRHVAPDLWTNVRWVELAGLLVVGVIVVWEASQAIG